MTNVVKKAVVILSGGLDSSTCMGVAQEQGYTIYALTFDYGQRHQREIEAAKEIAKYYDVVEHQIVVMPFFRQIGKSALTDDRIEVPKEGVNPEAIPVTYVPGRNLIFLSLATAYAETVEASAIFIGVNALDYSGYPDCRTEFIEAFQHAAQIATKTGVQGLTLSIETPLQQLSKADIVRLGTRLNVPYSLTTSCYQGEEEACGECDSCRLRLEGFRQAGLVDPIAYRKIITR